jgi:hypothetical protein
MADGNGNGKVAEVFQDPREINSIGDLFANIWQVCYVTADLDRGMELLGERLGIENFMEVPVEGSTFLKGDEPVDWNPRVAMGAKGGPIVELIEPVSGEVDFYRRFLPESGADAVAFHHLAVLTPLGDESWESTRAVFTDQGLDYEYTIVIPDRARLAYVDTTALLGHYLEICQLQPADTEFFTGLIEGST